MTQIQIRRSIVNAAAQQSMSLQVMCTDCVHFQRFNVSSPSKPIGKCKLNLAFVVYEKILPPCFALFYEKKVTDL